MRGHGSTVVGTSLEQAVYRAIYAEVNAKLQLAGAGLGEITFLNKEEAQLSSDMNDGQIPRSWSLWIDRDQNWQNRCFGRRNHLGCP